VSSRASLRLCLFGDTVFSPRRLNARDDRLGELVATIRALALGKAERHALTEGKVRHTRDLSLIGG